jgi:hypothetical protein
MAGELVSAAWLRLDRATPFAGLILERLGFVAITSTTPYIWTPPE